MQSSALGGTLNRRGDASDTRDKRAEGRRTDAPYGGISAGGSHGCEAGSERASGSRQSPESSGVARWRRAAGRGSREACDSIRRASRDPRYAGVSRPSWGRSRSKCGVDSDRRSGDGAPRGARVARVPRARGEAGRGADTRFRIGRQGAAGGAGRGTRGGGDRRGGPAAVARTAGVHRELGHWPPAIDPDPGAARRRANHGHPRSTQTVGVGLAAPVAPCPGTIRGTPGRHRRRARN
jgi:hypothetical protein